jgi:hypothetical protein
MRNFFPSGLTLAVAASLLLACAAQSPDEKLLDAARPAASWLATLRMTGEQWIANSVPKSFVTSTVAAARKDLLDVAEEAGKSPARPEARLPLQRLMHEARAAGSGLQHAVEAGDRPAAARTVERIRGLQERIAAWQRQEEQQGKAP